MTEERLTGLALMNIHGEESLNIDSIIDRFGSKQDRRMKFVL